MNARVCKVHRELQSLTVLENETLTSFSPFDISSSVVPGQQPNKFVFWKISSLRRQINQTKFFSFTSHKAATCLSSLMCELFFQRRQQLNTQLSDWLTALKGFSTGTLAGKVDGEHAIFGCSFR